MKGRLYDPALRRFTTADPYVTEPLNPQGLNRYSYVQNNPMNFTDPSGFYTFQLTIQTGQGPDVQVSVTIPDMQVTYAPSMPSPQQMADMSNAASNQQGQVAQEQHAGQNGDLTNQASQRAMEQAQAQNRTNQDAQRAYDAAFMNPYTPPGPNDLNNGGPRLGNTSDYRVAQSAGAIPAPNVPNVPTLVELGVAAWQAIKVVGAAASTAALAVTAALAMTKDSSDKPRTFEILDGVRRAKAAEMTGRTSILSTDTGSGLTYPIPLNLLLSPKPSIETSGAGLERWQRALLEVIQGNAAPIYVQPGTRGIPISAVIVEGGGK